MAVATQERERGENRPRPIRRMFIANRGEIAVRAAAACEKRGIQAIIPYSDLESERESYVTRLADKNINKGWDLVSIGGISADDSYANPHVMLDAAIMAECDAVFLGYGFLAERADFIQMCEDTGIRTLAPSSAAMEVLGEKDKALKLVEKIRLKGRKIVPLLKHGDTRTEVSDLIQDAERIGFPVMVKDPEGGGGGGNGKAKSRDEINNQYTRLRVGENKGLYVEKLIENGVHVEMQIVADQHGNVVSLGERDCTLQRNYQKLVEESPSPHITDNMRKGMQDAAIAIAKGAGYQGAGTVEFIVDMDSAVGKKGDKEFFFMEVNPRIQVEHPVTEEQTGIDIVNLMIDIAEGKPLPFKQEDIRPQGHTIEVRVYAEDPVRNFEQQEGILDIFRLPEDMEGVRVEKGYEEGDEVSSWYDPTLYKIIAHGDTRQEALHRVEQALAGSQIAGVKTNREFLAKLIDTPEFRQGQVTTDFIKDWMVEKKREAREEQNSIEKLLGNNGVFTPYPPSRLLDEVNFPVNPIIKTPNSDRPMTLREYEAKQQEKTGKECGSEYGIVERDGIRFVVYALDPNFNNGTFGKAEGLMLEDASRLAYENNLPLITLSSTAGVRNGQNNQGLQMMTDSIENSTRDYPPLFHIDIRQGYVLGGVPASYAGAADITIAINDGNTFIGLTGPSALAGIEDVKVTDAEGKPSTKATDAYRALDEEFAEGETHTPKRHHEMRTGADILVDNMDEAGDKITHMLSILKTRHPQISTDDNLRQDFKPKERIGYTPMPHPVALYSSPDSHLPSFIPPRLSPLYERARHLLHRSKREETIFSKPLSIGERRRIVNHPDRLTALDCIDPAWGIFDDAVLLDHVSFVNGVHKTSPIISAIAQYGEYPLLVLAQQPQQKRNDKGEIEVDHEPIRPSDWRATRRFLTLSEKLGIMVIQMGNTTGASASRASEDQGQTTEIAQTTVAVVAHKTPIVSINYGVKGSGGGVPFIWHADYAAAWENATSWVANPPAMRSFIERVELLDEASATAKQLAELDRFAEQFHDATAEGQLENHEIDLILKEGPGGAHLHPKMIIEEMRRMFDSVIPDLWEKYRNGTLMSERRKRKEEVASVGSKPNPNYEKLIAELEE